MMQNNNLNKKKKEQALTKLQAHPLPIIFSFSALPSPPPLQARSSISLQPQAPHWPVCVAMEMGEEKYFAGWKCPPCCTELGPAEARRLELLRWPLSARRWGGGANSRPSIPRLRSCCRGPGRDGASSGMGLQAMRISLWGGKSADTRRWGRNSFSQHKVNIICPGYLRFSWHLGSGLILCKGGTRKWWGECEKVIWA